MPLVLEPGAGAFDLWPRSLFVSYHGVITLVYDGWPDSAMSVKVCSPPLTSHWQAKNNFFGHPQALAPALRVPTTGNQTGPASDIAHVLALDTQPTEN